MAAERPYRPVRVLRVKKTDSLKTIYAKAKKTFTADDLAEFLDTSTKGVPAEQLVNELYAVHKARLQKMKKSKKK